MRRGRSGNDNLTIMSDLTIRHLLIDLDTPIPRHWNGGDAFRTAVFDALSFSFPAGEQVFIDSMKLGLAKLTAEQRERHEPEIRGFIGQEATHRRIHQRYNAHLEQMGYVNHWEPRIWRRTKRLEGVDARGWLAVTAATEHFTAILAEYLLENEAPLQGAEPRLATLWRWHSAEESEHRCSAFDLYRLLGGNELWRRRLFYLITLHFSTDLLRQTLHNLWRDGSWKRWSTWRNGARFLFGRDGLLRAIVPRWREYLKPDFHPSQGNGEPGQRWLQENAAIAPPVRA